MRIKIIQITVLFAMALTLSACLSSFWPDPKPAAGSQTRVASRVTMRWDHRPEGATWTRATLAALRSHGAALPAMTPRDIGAYCPGYPNASLEDRQLFWTGLISALAKWESTWRPDAVGGNGRWYGLTQIYPDTARRYGCNARSGAALKNGSANLSCAVRIMAVTIPRDGVISRGGRGFAADWAPFNIRHMRDDIANWTRVQPFCNR